MMNTLRFDPQDSSLTQIYAGHEGGGILVGFIDPAGEIYRLEGRTGVPLGYISRDRAVMRRTAHDIRELGVFSEEGEVTSHGLFEGGALGWVEANGTVVRAGLIFGEEEVGRVVGPDIVAAGAALLLLFLPEADEDRRSRMQGI